jgi:DNA-binding MarR family transcriptional regulator
MKEPAPLTLDSRLQETPAPEGTLLRLFHIMGLLRHLMEPYFAQHGISGPQWAILRIVKRAYDEGERSLAQKEISRRLLIKPPSVTALVDRLERMGLLQRGASDDLRVRMVGLTAAGRKLIATIQKSHSAQIGSLFGGFTAVELKQFHGLLGTMGAHLAAQSPLTADISTRKAKAPAPLSRLPRKK